MYAAGISVSQSRRPEVPGNEAFSAALRDEISASGIGKTS
jgi:hypothetical protein